MNITEAISNLREKLLSQLPSDYVQLGYHSNGGLVPGAKIREVLDCAEKLSNLIEAGLHTPNPLEKLAMELLLESAHMRE